MRQPDAHPVGFLICINWDLAQESFLLYNEPGDPPVFRTIWFRYISEIATAIFTPGFRPSVCSERNLKRFRFVRIESRV